MNINEIGEARGTVLSLKLDKISDSVVGKTNVDTKGYLTDLNSLPINTDADIGKYNFNNKFSIIKKNRGF